MVSTTTPHKSRKILRLPGGRLFHQGLKLKGKLQQVYNHSKKFSPGFGD
jgi:hypothetical protein